MARHTAIREGGLGFDLGMVKSTIANGPPPVRCFFRAVLPRRNAAGTNPTAGYTLRRNSASIFKTRK